MTPPALPNRYFLVVSAGICIVVSAGIFIVESDIIFVESIIMCVESVAIFSPAIVVSFAGAAAAAGAGAGAASGWGLLHPVSKQAAAKAESASVRVISCLFRKSGACSARRRLRAWGVPTAGTEYSVPLDLLLITHQQVT